MTSEHRYWCRQSGYIDDVTKRESPVDQSDHIVVFITWTLLSICLSISVYIHTQRHIYTRNTHKHVYTTNTRTQIHTGEKTIIQTRKQREPLPQATNILSESLMPLQKSPSQPPPSPLKTTTTTKTITLSKKQHPCSPSPTPQKNNMWARLSASDKRRCCLYQHPLFKVTMRLRWQGELSD